MQPLPHPSSTYKVCLLFFPPPYSAWMISPEQFSAHMMCPKYGSFCLSISTSNVHGGVIYSSSDLFALLAVHGIFSLQHHMELVSNTTFQNYQSSSFLSFSQSTTHIQTMQLQIPEHSPASSWWPIVTSLSFQIFVNPDNAVLPNANRLWISPPHSPFTSILQHRKMNISIISKWSSLNLNSSIFSVDKILVLC